MVILLTLASLAVSSAASDHPALSVFGTIWRRYGALPQAVLLLFAWMVAAQTSGRLDRVRTILRGIVVSGVLGAAYGICQYAGWDPLLSPARYHIGEGIWTIVRPPGTMGYVSYFASWLLLTVFLSLTLASLEDSRWWRRFAYFGAALSLTAMALTGTRAALAGLAAGAVVAAIPARWFPNVAPRRGAGSCCGDRGGPHSGSVPRVGTCAAGRDGLQKIRGAAPVRCFGRTVCGWLSAIPSWVSGRRPSRDRFRSTNRRHWRAPIPTSRTNRLTTCSWIR